MHIFLLISLHGMLQTSWQDCILLQLLPKNYHKVVWVWYWQEVLMVIMSDHPSCKNSWCHYYSVLSVIITTFMVSDSGLPISQGLTYSLMPLYTLASSPNPPKVNLGQNKNLFRELSGCITSRVLSYWLPDFQKGFKEIIKRNWDNIFF